MPVAVRASMRIMELSGGGERKEAAMTKGSNAASSFFEGLIEWRVIAGNALHVVWGWLMFTGSAFASPEGGFIDATLLPDPLYTLSLGANALVLACFSVLGKEAGPLFRRKGTPAASALLMSLGTFLASGYVGIVLGRPTVAVEVLAGVLTGMGAAVFLLLWGEAFVSLGVRGCLLHFAISSFAAATLHLAAGLAPVSWVQAAVLAVPLVELALYRSFVSRSRAALSRSNRAKGDAVRLPLNVVVLGLFFGFSFGAMRGFLLDAEQGGSVDTRHAVSMVAIMAACAFAWAVSIARRSDFGKLAYRIGIPLVALGFLLLPLSGAWSLTGTAAYRFGYQYVYLVLWGLWVLFARMEEARSTWILACGLVSVQASKLVGFVVSADAMSLADNVLNIRFASSVLLFAVVLFTLFAKEGSASEKDWERVLPAAEAEEGLAGFEQAYAPAVERFRLTPREAEVFYLLLKGRSRAHIAKELVVTEETVKSHIKSIYQKAGVHGKQELIDQAEAAAARGGG